MRPVVLSWPYNLLPGTGISKTGTRKRKHISATACCLPETYTILVVWVRPVESFANGAIDSAACTVTDVLGY
jgi:hypothetical protein